MKLTRRSRANRRRYDDGWSSEAISFTNDIVGQEEKKEGDSCCRESKAGDSTTYKGCATTSGFEESIKEGASKGEEAGR